MTRILILCTGNSCRSQMAEGLLKNIDTNLEIYSAGTKPEKEVNRFAVLSMKMIRIDISSYYPKNVDQFKEMDFDYVITVCDNAKSNCPVFIGKVKTRLHLGVEDPAAYIGSYTDTINKYNSIRDELQKKFLDFYNNYIIS